MRTDHGLSRPERNVMCLAKFCWSLNWHLRTPVSGSVTGYLHPKTVHDKVKPLCTQFTEMLQLRSKIIFLPSYVYLYVSSCDTMYKDVKDWSCQMQDLLLSILRMSYKEINTMYGVCICVNFIVHLNFDIHKSLHLQIYSFCITNKLWSWLGWNPMEFRPNHDHDR
jgi:hypothetical protein